MGTECCNEKQEQQRYALCQEEATEGHLYLYDRKTKQKFVIPLTYDQGMILGSMELESIDEIKTVGNIIDTPTEPEAA